MTDDELDRALFALPLATPPAGLRDRIVALTLEAAPAPSPSTTRALILNASDIAAIAVTLALATWLVLSGLARTAIGESGVLIQNAGSLVERAGGESTLLVWLGVGVAIAAIATYIPRLDLPLRRS